MDRGIVDVGRHGAALALAAHAPISEKMGGEHLLLVLLGGSNPFVLNHEDNRGDADEAPPAGSFLALPFIADGDVDHIAIRPAELGAARFDEFLNQPELIGAAQLLEEDVASCSVVQRPPPTRSAFGSSHPILTIHIAKCI